MHLQSSDPLLRGVLGQEVKMICSMLNHCPNLYLLWIWVELYVRCEYYWMMKISVKSNSYHRISEGYKPGSQLLVEDPMLMRPTKSKYRMEKENPTPSEFGEFFFKYLKRRGLKTVEISYRTCFPGEYAASTFSRRQSTHDRSNGAQLW